MSAMAFGYCQTIETLRPVPSSNKEIANEEQFKILTRLVDFVNENQLQLPFSMPEEELGEERGFIAKMKLDPRDGPTAKELLHDV